MSPESTARQVPAGEVDALAADVGRRIRAARQERGMSLAQLGGNDLSRSFISLVELGRSRISLRALSIIAGRLDLPVSHFLAGEALGGEAMAEMALDAAEVALSRQDAEECLHLLDHEALDEVAHPRAAALRARALIDLGRPRDAFPVAERGLSIAERRGDQHLVTELAYLSGVALYSAGNYDEALVHLRRALQEATSGPEDPVILGKITVCIGHVLYVRGDVEGAIEQYARARELFGSIADLNSLGSVYSGLSLAHKRLGDRSNALRYSKLSVAAFEARQNVRQMARELNNLAVRYHELGSLDQALESGRESAARARAAAAPDVEAAAHSTLASIHLARQELEEAAAEALLVDDLAMGESEGDLARPDAWIVLAEIAERSGDRDRADTLYRRALHFLRDAGHQTAWADAALGYSLLLRERGDTGGALEYAVQAAQAKTARP